MLRHKLIVVAAIIGIATQPALAQVRQSGSVTTGHAVQWATNGVVQDAGTAGSGSINTFGITNTGTPLCINDAATSGQYHQFCLGANSLGGGLLSYNAYGGAASLPLQVNINGTTTVIGTGTINSGTAGQLSYYATTGSTLSGTSYMGVTNGTLALGTAGSISGGLTLAGSSSGIISVLPQAAAGTFNFNMPTTAGTVGQALVSGGGGSAPMTWASFSGTVNSGSAGQFGYYAGTGTTISGSSVLSVTGGVINVAGGLTASGGADTFSPSNANVVLSPTGTGVVTISPASLGTLDNLTIGGTTAAVGTFSTLSSKNAVSAGVAGVSAGTYNLSGSTSGTITIQPQTAAGTYNFNLPITAGSASAPLLSGGGGSSPMTYGTRSGNTTTFATTTGALTTGHGAAFDASGNIIDGGAFPTGSINSGTAGQLTYYAGSGTTVSGNANATISSGALTLGVTGAAAGSEILSGSSTGAITIKGSGTTIGTYNFNLPTSAGSSGGPLLSGGGAAAAMTWGTPSGSTTTFGTVTGALTNGHCIAADASGNLIDNGSTCGTGGSGTVTSSTAGQIAYYASSTNAVAGNSSLTISGGAVTVGVPTTTTGSIALAGSTSSTVTIKPQAAAGGWEFDLPTTAGSSGQVLTSAGGAGAAMTWSTISSYLSWGSNQTTGFTAAANTSYCTDTTSGAYTMTLPASPSNGDKVGFQDCSGTFATNKLTIGRNAKKIMGAASDMDVTRQYAAATLVYNSTNGDWRIGQ